MKLYFKIGIVLVFALLAWLLLQDKAETISKVNTVSLQTTPVVIPEKPKPIKNNTTKKPQTITNGEISEEEKARLAKELKQLSYIQLYEKSLDLDDCLGYIQQVEMKKFDLEDGPSTNKKIDFIQEYKDNITRYSNYRQQQVTNKQVNAYQEYIDNCEVTLGQVKALLDEDEAKDKAIYSTLRKLSELMEQTKPQSEEGKILKQTIATIKKLRIDFNEVLELEKGIPTASKENVWKAEEEVQKARWKVYRLKQESEVDKQILKAVEADYKQKQDYLSSLFEFDKQAYENKMAELFTGIKDSREQLHTKYPHVFSEVFAGLNFSQRNENKLPNNFIAEMLNKLDIGNEVLSKQITNNIAIKNKEYFNQLLQPALDLYLCYLGQNCKLPLNRRLARYCYQPENSYSNSGRGIFQEACDVSLEEFYLEHYLTENQVKDLNLIFDYLVETYAK